ncbi:MAG: HAD family hydrolase [Deltaproteobacteria bacterium]|nr:HAD family hydrolase [Deltaproteobacteria bacterium]
MSGARVGGSARFRAVLFDLDGTLTDPKPGITRSVQYALRKRGIEPPDADQLEPFIGPPLAQSFSERLGFAAAEAKRAVDDYREYFSRQGLYENSVYDGIPALLRELRESGRRVCLATSKPTVFAERILEHFDLARHFDLVVGSHLDGTRVAKAEIIAAVLAGLGGEAARRAVMVGDREHDVHGARSNGIDSIAVTYGYGTCEELQAPSPTSLAASVGELRRLLLAV